MLKGFYGAQLPSLYKVYTMNFILEDRHISVILQRIVDRNFAMLSVDVTPVRIIHQILEVIFTHFHAFPFL